MLKNSTLKIFLFLIFIATFLTITLCCFLDFKYSLHIFGYAIVFSFLNTFICVLICKNEFFDEKEQAKENLKIEMQNSEKNLTTILNNMPTIAYIVDLDYNIRACNTATLKYFRITPEESGQINQLSADVFERDTMEQMKEENDFILKSKKTFVTKRQIKLKNGLQNWFMIRKIPILNTAGDVSKFVVFCRNIDEEQNAQRMRESYISTLSHDLKIPTIAQIRALELLVNGDMGLINENQKEIINLTLESCYSMYDMLSTILTTYKYENNEINLNYEKIYMLKILDEAFAKVHKNLQNKNIRVKVMAKDKFASIFADKMQLKKAFENLIDFCVSNAYQDTMITCEIEKNGNGSIVIALKYESPYINPEVIDNMFEKYTTSAEKFNKVGSSLNLYLAKQIISAHEGVLNVKSEQSSYSKCKIELPCYGKCCVAC